MSLFILPRIVRLEKIQRDFSGERVLWRKGKGGQNIWCLSTLNKALRISGVGVMP